MKVRLLRLVIASAVSLFCAAAYAEESSDDWASSSSLSCKGLKIEDKFSNLPEESTKECEAQSDQAYTSCTNDISSSSYSEMLSSRRASIKTKKSIIDLYNGVIEQNNQDHNFKKGILEKCEALIKGAYETCESEIKSTDEKIKELQLQEYVDQVQLNQLKSRRDGSQERMDFLSKEGEKNTLSNSNKCLKKAEEDQYKSIDAQLRQERDRILSESGGYSGPESDNEAVQMPKTSGVMNGSNAGSMSGDGAWSSDSSEINEDRSQISSARGELSGGGASAVKASADGANPWSASPDAVKDAIRGAPSDGAGEAAAELVKDNALADKAGVGVKSTENYKNLFSKLSDDQKSSMLRELQSNPYRPSDEALSALKETYGQSFESLSQKPEKPLYTGAVYDENLRLVDAQGNQTGKDLSNPNVVKVASAVSYDDLSNPDLQKKGLSMQYDRQTYRSAYDNVTGKITDDFRNGKLQKSDGFWSGISNYLDEKTKQDPDILSRYPPEKYCQSRSDSDCRIFMCQYTAMKSRTGKAKCLD